MVIKLSKKKQWRLTKSKNYKIDKSQAKNATNNNTQKNALIFYCAEYTISTDSDILNFHAIQIISEIPESDDTDEFQNSVYICNCDDYINFNYFGDFGDLRLIYNPKPKFPFEHNFIIYIYI